MYSRWADAHGAGAPPEVVEYGKKEYERLRKQQIQEVNLEGSSDESTSDQDDQKGQPADAREEENADNMSV
eukprot:6814405-Pyramimonas_sp.AAC.1